MTETVGLILGSGYERLGFEVLTRSPTKTPYGEPSSAVLTLGIGGARVPCIVRHGERHEYAPHEINYRANVWALAQRGIGACVGINTVGGIASELVPGDLAVPDQLIDYTSGRVTTFGGAGSPVVHAEFTEPFAPALRARLADAVAATGLAVHAGTYGVTQGPRLETAAEIRRLRRDGCAMVGMTAMPEAALARELALDYAVLAVVVNHAAGCAPEGVSIGAEIERFLERGLRRAADVVVRLA